MAAARVAILGIAVESNAFAPVADRGTFDDYAYLKGDDVIAARVIDYWLGAYGEQGFFPAMSRLREWEPVPVLIADGQATGSVDHQTYLDIKDELLKGLRAALPVDAVYIVAHGAGRTTELHDMDGDYFRAVRAVVGDNVPIVATLDLHANLTPAMVKACDALVSQRTNPHVDSEARAEDAALLLHRMLSGWRPVQAATRVPFLTPQVSQLTERGQPMGDLVVRAEEGIAQGDYLGVSLLSGFSFADTPDNGLWLYALGEEASALRKSLTALADQVWAWRPRFTRATLSVEEAVQHALTVESLPNPLIYADIADNPGGGGTGNTIWLLEAFCAAGITNAIFAPFIDRELVAQAQSAGTGREIVAEFNRGSLSEFARPWQHSATVRWVGEGDYDAEYGVYAGSRVPLGPCAVLELAGNTVIVISAKQQLLGEDFITHFGVDASAARFIVGKSRGHFRAGFQHRVPPDCIFEVDSLGLTTAELDQVPWQNITRPIAPLDTNFDYVPAVDVFTPRAH
ncbi:MAG: M81 family metallopeptidase [Pseudomonadota bacterium]